MALAKSKIRAFIFDLDGTMIDSMPSHQTSWIEFARRHNVQLDVADLMRRTTGRTGTECMGELFGRVMTPAEALPLVHEKEAIYRELFAPEFRQVNGFKAFLAKTRAQGVQCAVGTAGDAANVAFAFSHLFTPSESDLIPSVVVRGDMGLAGKPDPAIFLEAARQLGCQPSECLVFEDAPFGIEAARRAGMQAVAIVSSHRAEELTGENVIAATSDYATLWTELDSRLRGNEKPAGMTAI
jgi:beta-phosphoglucomutase-like phosphatase (HAD superfamily)